MAAAPIIGPLLGGALLEIGTWHWIFWLMAAASAFLFILIFFFVRDIATAEALKRDDDKLV